MGLKELHQANVPVEFFQTEVLPAWGRGRHWPEKKHYFVKRLANKCFAYISLWCCVGDTSVLGLCIYGTTAAHGFQSRGCEECTTKQK